MTLPAQACSYKVCYQMEMLINPAEIVDRFCAKLNAIRYALYAQRFIQEIVTIET